MIQVFHSSLKFNPVNSGQVIFFHTKAFFHLKYDFSYSSCDCLAILTVASVVFIHSNVKLIWNAVIVWCGAIDTEGGSWEAAHMQLVLIAVEVEQS
jgi:hypothetical protein